MWVETMVVPPAIVIVVMGLSLVPHSTRVGWGSPGKTRRKLGQFGNLRSQERRPRAAFASPFRRSIAESAARPRQPRARKAVARAHAAVSLCLLVTYGVSVVMKCIVIGGGIGGGGGALGRPPAGGGGANHQTRG